MYFYLPYQIPFSETDQMGIVHHSNHSRYLERGRIELLRMIGMGYKEIVARGAHFPVTRLEVSFRRPLHFDDAILVETRITALSRTRLSFGYRIVANAPGAKESFQRETPLEGKALVEGVTEHCCVDNEGRPQEIEAGMRGELERRLVDA